MTAAAPLQLRELLRSLLEADIDFLIFGAVAAALYGHVRATADLDIVVAPDADNRRRLTDWLLRVGASPGADPASPLRERHLRAVHLGRNAWVLTPWGQLDIVQRITGLPDWTTLAERAATFDLGDMTVRAVDRNTLIRRKRARATPQDLADAEALEGLDPDAPPTTGRDT